jgi:hypothetical protein
MPPFSLIVSIVPPTDLDAETVSEALAGDERVRGVTARTPPGDPDSQMNVWQFGV